MAKKISKQQFKQMVQAALDNWDFSGYSNPDEGRQAKKGLEYLQTVDWDAPSIVKHSEDWDGLSEYVNNLGYEIETAQ